MRVGDGVGGRSAAADQAEVEQLGDVVDAAALADHDVGRLDVAVDQVHAVGLAQRRADLAQEVDDARRRQRAVALDDLLERQSRQVLHHVVEGAVVGVAVVVDLHRVPVGEPGGGPHLALEAGERVGVAGPIGPDQLDRHRLLEQQVLGQVDLAHPAGAEPPYQLVLPEPPRFGDLLAQLRQLGRAEDGDGRGQEHPEAHQRHHPAGARSVDRIGDGHRGRDQHRQAHLGADQPAVAAQCFGDEGRQADDPHRPADGHRLGRQANQIRVGGGATGETLAVEGEELAPADVEGHVEHQHVLEGAQAPQRPPAWAARQGHGGDRRDQADDGFRHQHRDPQREATK